MNTPEQAQVAKHTRGPWTLTHVAGSNFAVQEFRIKAPFGNTPNVYPIFNRNTSGIDDASVFISPENAHLIVAAPELLEALQRIVNNPGAQIGGHIRAEANAAIAKAGGQHG